MNWCYNTSKLFLLSWLNFEQSNGSSNYGHFETLFAFIRLFKFHYLLCQLGPRSSNLRGSVHNSSIISSQSQKTLNFHHSGMFRPINNWLNCLWVYKNAFFGCCMAYIRETSSAKTYNCLASCIIVPPLNFARESSIAPHAFSRS